jgi:hypothetical protein
MKTEKKEDLQEIRDEKVRRFIDKSHEQYMAGQSRPAEELLAELRDIARRSRLSTKRRKK